MSVEEMKFFMEFFPRFRKLPKEKQTSIGLVIEGARIAAGVIGK